MRIASYGQYIPGLHPDYMVRELFNINPFINLSRELMITQLYQRTKHIYNDISALREYLDNNKPNKISFVDANISGNVVIARITVTSQAPTLQNHRSFHVINSQYETALAFRDMTLAFYPQCKSNKYDIEGAYYYFFSDLINDYISSYPRHSVQFLKDLCTAPFPSYDESIDVMNEIIKLNPKFCLGSLIERCTWDGPIDLELTRSLNRLGIYGANRQYSLNGNGKGYELELRSREHPSIEDLHKILEGIHSIDTSREGRTIVRFNDLGGVSDSIVDKITASCKYLACNILKY